MAEAIQFVGEGKVVRVEADSCTARCTTVRNFAFSSANAHSPGAPRRA